MEEFKVSSLESLLLIPEFTRSKQRGFLSFSFNENRRFSRLEMKP